jgi:hypothetical protein
MAAAGCEGQPGDTYMLRCTVTTLRPQWEPVAKSLRPDEAQALVCEFMRYFLTSHPPCPTVAPTTYYHQYSYPITHGKNGSAPPLRPAYDLPSLKTV